MEIKIDSKLLKQALDLLHEYAYEAERDGDIWKAKEVTECAHKVRSVLFPSMDSKEKDDWTKKFMERVRTGEKTLWDEGLVINGVDCRGKRVYEDLEVRIEDEKREGEG